MCFGAVIHNFVVSIFCNRNNYIFIFSSRSSLQPVDLEEDTVMDLSYGEDEVVAGPSRLASRPGTPLTPTPRSTCSSPHPTEVGQRSATPTQQLSEIQRSATPPPHPRVQLLSSGSATQPSRKKRRGSKTPVDAEQQLLDILTAERVPVPPHVPNDGEAMYFFSLSLVPMLNRLPRSTQTRAQMHILQYLRGLEEEEEIKRTQAPLTTQPQAYPSASHYQPGHTLPPTTYHGPAQPPTMYHHQGQTHLGMQHSGQHGGVKRSSSMLEELEDLSCPRVFQQLQ